MNRNYSLSRKYRINTQQFIHFPNNLYKTIESISFAIWKIGNKINIYPMGDINGQKEIITSRV